MSNIKRAVPFYRVTDIERTARFYLDGLGFQMTRQWTPQGKLRWCWLERDDVAVMLQQNAAVQTGSLSMYFICEDALALYREFLSKGLDAAEPFVGNGMLVTSVKDPDGYQLFFESFTDVPEETLLSQVR